MKGQKILTDFFSSTKSANVHYKKAEPMTSTYKVEEVLQTHRGADDVKLLWMPKLHCELDASKYVSAVLLNEIARETEGAAVLNVSDIEAIIDRFPNEVWSIIANHVKKCEDFFLNNGILPSSKDDNKKSKTEEP